VVGRAAPAAVKAAGTGEMVAHREDPAVSVDVDRAVPDQMARVQIILVAPVVLEVVRQPAIRYWLALVNRLILRGQACAATWLGFNLRTNWQMSS
jgi:hypothetical protein